MPISFIDRRCTVDVHPTANGYSFEYGGKRLNRSNEEAVHAFFLKEYRANKLDTVKLRFQNSSYFLHFTLDEPEKCTKPQLRLILARECEGAWCEEKNGKQRFFIREGWLFPKIKEITQEEFDAHRPSSTIQKAMKLAIGALSLAPSLTSHASRIGTLLFSLLNAAPALAQVSTELRINTNTTNQQQNSYVASLTVGGLAVWVGGQTGDDDIYGQRYEQTGDPAGQEFRINTNTTNIQSNPKFATLMGAGFIVIWVGTQNGDEDIYGQRFDDVGSRLGSEFRINTNTTNSQSSPAVAALKNGGFFVAWSGRQTGDYDIYGQRFDAAGAPVGSEFRINTDTIGIQSTPEIAALNDGGFLAAWMGSQTGDYDIYGQKYNVTGTQVDSEFRINTNTSYNQMFPSLATLNDGRVVAAWNSQQAGDNDIYGQRFDAAGTLVGSEFQINTNTTSQQLYPFLLALINGGYVAAWQGLQTGDFDIYGQRFDAALDPAGSEFRINTNTTNNQISPSILFVYDGGFVTAWAGDQTGDNDIYAQRFDSNGVPIFVSPLTSPSITMSSLATSTAISSSSLLSPTASLSLSSQSALQIGSSSVPSTQTTTGFTSLPSTTSSSVLPTSTSQEESNSSTLSSSSLSATINSPSSSRSSIILSITEIIYGSDYSIFNSNGESIGTFTITGGTGLYDGTQANTLILQLDPDADLVGQTITLFAVPSDEEGNFQTIELQGVSCLSYDTQTVQDGGSRFYQATIQATTCSLGSKPASTLIPTMLRV